jgi:hypothetical protein
MDDVVSGAIEKNKTRGGTGGGEYGNLLIPSELGRNAMFKVNAGTRVKFDILPYTIIDEKHLDRDDERGRCVPGSLTYYRPYYVHRNIGSEKETVTCLKTWGEPCPICEYVEQRRKEGSEEAKQETNIIKSKYWTLFAVIPIDNDDYEEDQIKLFNFSHYCFHKRLLMDIEEKDWERFFADIKKGKTLSVRFSEEALPGGKSYTTCTDIDFIERKYEYPEEILDQVPNLDNILVKRSYDELQNMLLGGSSVEEEEYTAPSSSGKKYFKVEKEEENDDPPFDKGSSVAKTIRRAPKNVTPQEPKKESVKNVTPEKTVKTIKTVKSASKESSSSKTPEKEEEEDDESEQRSLSCPIGLEIGRDWNTADYCEKCEINGECYSVYKTEWKA